MELVGYCYIGCSKACCQSYDTAVYSSNGVEVGESINLPLIPIQAQDITWYYPHAVQNTLPKAKNVFKRMSPNTFLIQARVIQDGDSEMVIMLELHLCINRLNLKFQLAGISSIISCFSDAWSQYIDCDTPSARGKLLTDLKANYLRNSATRIDVTSASSWIKDIYESLSQTQSQFNSYAVVGSASQQSCPPVPIATSARLQRLPAELLRIIFSFLDAKSQCRCASQSKYLYDCYWDHLQPPGLLLTLYRHQRAALQWMTVRESRSFCSVPSLYVRTMHTRNSGRKVQVHLLNDECIIHSAVDDCIDPASCVPLPRSWRSQIRGGMLCDEPGLGKTITALSLILRTLGALPEETVSAIDVDSRLRRNRVSADGIDSDKDENEDIRDHARNKSRRSSKRMVRPNTLLFSSPSPACTPTRLQQQSTPTPNDSPLPSSSPSPLPIPLVEDEAKVVMPPPLLRQSPATLIVVPDVLVKQWAFQINSHVSSRLHLYSGFPADRLLYVDPYMSATSPPMLEAAVMAEFVIVLVPFSRMSSEYRKYTASYHSQFAHHTYMPMHRYNPTPQPRYVPSLLQIYFLRIIVDEGHGLTSGPYVPDVMSMVTLVPAERRWVLTGTPTTIPVLNVNTISQLQSQIKSDAVSTASSSSSNSNSCNDNGNTSSSSGDGSDNDATAVTSPNRAARSAETTVAPRLVCGVEAVDFNMFASHLYRLFAFLQVRKHCVFGGVSSWRALLLRSALLTLPVLHTRSPQTEVQLPEILHSMLGQVMMRQQKRNIDIPLPVRTTVLLPLNASERHSYNATVALAMVNLVATGLDYRLRNGSHPDSLLNPRNSLHLRNILRNIRIAACGGGHAVLTLSPTKFRETIELLEQWGQPPEVREKVREYMVRVLQNDLHIRSSNSNSGNQTSGRGAASGDGTVMYCEYCDLELDILLVVPCCGCQLCPLCLDKFGDYCPVCAETFDWEKLQLLQPGFDAKEFVFDASESENRVGVDGGDAANGAVGGAFDAPAPVVNAATGAATTITMSASTSNTQSESLNLNQSSKARYLVEKILQYSAEYERQLQSRNCNNSSSSQCRVRFDCIDSVSLNESVPCSSSSSSTTHSPPPLPPKVIVFSQFPEFLDCIAVALRQASIKFVDLINKHSASQVLAQFEHNQSVRVLLLGKLGSVGLDLSYVTHIFLMEPVLDYTIEDQLISRAYRLGCRQSVMVTLLVMKHTIEEVIYDLVRNMNENSYLFDLYANVSVTDLSTTNYCSSKLSLMANQQDREDEATADASNICTGNIANKDIVLSHHLIRSLSLVLTPT